MEDVKKYPIIGTGYKSLSMIKDGMDAMTLNLSNESHTIPYVGTEGNYYGCETIATLYWGNTPINEEDIQYTTSASEGVVGEWNRPRRCYTVTQMSTDSGYVDITAIYKNEKRYTSRFSLSKSYSGKDGYTINLSNDSHVFISDSEGIIADRVVAVTTVQAFVGLDPILAELDEDEIKSKIKPGSGIKDIKVNGQDIYITVQDTDGTIPAGYLEIPMRIDGKRAHRTFNWFKVKAAKDGQNGQDGNGYLITMSKDSYVANTNNLIKEEEIVSLASRNIDYGNIIYRSEDDGATLELDPTPYAHSLTIGNYSKYGSYISCDYVGHRDSFYEDMKQKILIYNNNQEVTSSSSTPWSYGTVYLKSESADGYQYHPLVAYYSSQNYCVANGSRAIILGKVDSYTFRILQGSGVYDRYVGPGQTHSEERLVKDLGIVPGFEDISSYADGAIRKIGTSAIELYGSFGGKKTLKPSDVGLSSFNTNAGFLENYYYDGYAYVGPYPSATYSVTYKAPTFVDGKIGRSFDIGLTGRISPNSNFSLQDKYYLHCNPRIIYNNETIGHGYVSEDWDKPGNIYPDTSISLDSDGIEMLESLLGKTITIENNMKYESGVGMLDLPFIQSTQTFVMPTSIDVPFIKKENIMVGHDTINFDISFQNLKGKDFKVKIEMDNRTFAYDNNINADNNALKISVKDLLADTKYNIKLTLTRIEDNKSYTIDYERTTLGLPPSANIFALKDVTREGTYDIMYQISSSTELKNLKFTLNDRTITGIDFSKQLDKLHIYTIDKEEFKLRFGNNKIVMEMSNQTSGSVKETINVYHAENTPAEITDINIKDITSKSFTVTYRAKDIEEDKFRHYIKIQESGKWTEIFPERDEFGRFVYTHIGAPAGTIPIYLKTVDEYNNAEFVTDKIIILIPFATPPKIQGLSIMEANVEGECRLSYEIIDTTITNIDELTHYVSVNGSGLKEITPNYKDGKFEILVRNLAVGNSTIGLAVKNTEAISETSLIMVEIPVLPPPEFESIVVSEERRSGTFKITYKLKSNSSLEDVKYHLINIDNIGFKTFKPVIKEPYVFEYNGKDLTKGIHHAQIAVETDWGRGYSDLAIVTIPENYAPEIETMECVEVYSGGMFTLEYRVTDENEDLSSHHLSIDDGEYKEIVPQNPTKNNFVYTGKGLSHGRHKITLKVSDGYDDAVKTIYINVPIRDILGRFSNARSYISVSKNNIPLAAVEENAMGGQFSFVINESKCVECVAIKDSPNSFYVDSVVENNGIVCVEVNCEGEIVVEKYFSLALVNDGEEGEQGPTGSDAQVPDWVKEWDGEMTEINGQAMYSPRIFAGEGGRAPTGIGLGRNALGEANDSSTTGLGIYNKGVIIGQFNSQPDSEGVMITLGVGSNKLTVNSKGEIKVPKMTADEIVSQINNGFTYIHGGMILTGTLSADTINGGTINGAVVNVINLNASNITAGKISSEFIDVGELSAGKVESSGNYGTVQIENGHITMWERSIGSGVSHDIYPSDWPVRVGMGAVIDSNYSSSSSIYDPGFKHTYMPSKLTGAAHKFYLDSLWAESVTNVQVYVPGLSDLDIQYIAGISTSCTISEAVTNPISIDGNYVNVRIRNTTSINIGSQNVVVFVTILGRYL